MQRDGERCRNFAAWLAFLEVEDDTAREVAILEKVSEVGLNRADFVHLDEKPGELGYHLTPEGYWAKPGEGGEWHWKLRRVRNDDNDLFDRLHANS